MSDPAAGSIYDLGYRNYDGVRLGRRHAIWALYLYSLRNVFGIGRSLWAKVGSIGIIFLAFLPAIVVLGLASIFSDAIDEVFAPVDYYGFISILLIIFCAVVAPEVVGRDQQTKTLSLYFSRALVRQDYALAKFFALLTGMLSMTLLPQLLMFVGNGFVGDDFAEYLGDTWEDLPSIVGSSLIISAVFAGMGLVIASQTSKRAYSTVGILAFFLLSFAIVQGIFESDPDLGRFLFLVSPLHIFEGMTLWLFDTPPDPASDHAKADIPGAAFTVAALTLGSLLLALLIRRYDRIST